MAARELAKAGKKILIIEAGNCAGGRIHTIRDKGFSQPVEEGAEFMHGKLPVTTQLLKEAGISYTETSGKIYRYKNSKLEEQKDFIEGNEKMEEKIKGLPADMPVADFLKQYFGWVEHAEMRRSVTNFIEGYEAADAKRASVKAMQQDLMEDDIQQYRIEGGYVRLIDFLRDECEKAGCIFRMNEQVKDIYWSRGLVNIKTNNSSFKCTKVLVAAPIGILQAEHRNISAIRFHPSLPQQYTAAKTVGSGKVIKVLLEFKERFWPADAGFIFSEEPIPTWWTQQPKDNKLLTGWLGGPNTEQYKRASDEALLTRALSSLSSIFDITLTKENMTAWHVANWQNYPFTKCAYSYATVGSDAAKKKLNEPVKETIYFAGEAVYEGNATGTVEAALDSALQMVKKILGT